MLSKKRMNAIIKHICLLAAAFAVLACNRGGGNVENPVPSIYYWRTVFSLDSAERQFLAHHGVKRIYMRYFDVVARDSMVVPNATIKFVDSVPQGVEVVPTVFIVENCLNRDLKGVAAKLVERIVQMNETHDIPAAREIQIDCDWTSRSQERYYKFLDEVRALLRDRGMRLSATIRLHQLSMKVPPVDYGVLMMYNTGDINKKNGRNPILDRRDVEPYLKQVGAYGLPLCAAWPCYTWNLLYHDNSFKGILYDVNLKDSSIYRKAQDGHYVVLSSRGLPEPNSDGSNMTWINVGDSVIVMRPTASEVLSIADAIEQQRPGINRQVVMYSLDSKNINNYNNQFYEEIYSR